MQKNNNNTKKTRASTQKRTFRKHKMCVCATNKQMNNVIGFGLFSFVFRSLLR